MSHPTVAEIIAERDRALANLATEERLCCQYHKEAQDATAERDAARAELAAEREARLADMDAISAAIGTCAFMDPPDGGSPTLAEQVARMRRALDTADANVVQWKERAKNAEAELCEAWDALGVLKQLHGGSSKAINALIQGRNAAFAERDAARAELATMKERATEAEGLIHDAETNCGYALQERDAARAELEAERDAKMRALTCAADYAEGNEKLRARVAELEGLMRHMCNGMRKATVQKSLDDAWLMQAAAFVMLADAALAKGA